MIVLAVFAVVCLAVIVWAAPGVIRKHRQDGLAQRIARQFALMKQAFSQLQTTAEQAARSMADLADVLKKGPTVSENEMAEIAEMRFS